MIAASGGPLSPKRVYRSLWTQEKLVLFESAAGRTGRFEGIRLLPRTPVVHRDCFRRRYCSHHVPSPETDEAAGRYLPPTQVRKRMADDIKTHAEILLSMTLTPPHGSRCFATISTGVDILSLIRLHMSLMHENVNTVFATVSDGHIRSVHRCANGTTKRGAISWLFPACAVGPKKLKGGR